MVGYRGGMNLVGLSAERNNLDAKEEVPRMIAYDIKLCNSFKPVFYKRHTENIYKEILTFCQKVVPQVF